MTAGYIFALLAGQGRVVYHKMHGNGRLGNLLEWNRCNGFRVTQGVTDMNIGNTGDCYDRAHAGFPDFHFIKTVKFV